MAEPIMLRVIQPIKSSPYPIADKPPSRKIKIGQVQLNTSFSGQYYFPLAAGMLQAYAQRHLAFPDHYEFGLPIYKFMRIEEASEILSDSDIVAVSSYVWGEQNSLAIAKDYKRRKPNGIVVFGGPQVPDSKKQFRRNRTDELTEDEQKRKRTNFTPDFHYLHPFIDICLHGEGERTFRYVLEQIAVDDLRDKSRLPSASYLDANGNFHYNPKIGRMNNEEILEAPSPFTTGVFDKLMLAHPDQKWIMMYETDRGCPYTCTYCDWGGATEDKISKFSMEQIYADFMWAGEHRIPYIFLCNANFGILPRDVEIAEYLAECKSKYGHLQGVSTQNAKNPKKHTIEALRVLEKAGLNKATVMSQQTLNPDSLKEIERDNMDLSEYEEMQRQLAAEGVYTMTDYIIALPKESYQTLIGGISTLITRGQHNRIQFNFLSILRNTKMGNPEYQEKNGFQIVRTPITNFHGKRNDTISEIDEVQELVVATSTMPPDDWVKSHTLCWLVNLIYFNKLLQIPIIILHEIYKIPYEKIFEAFMEKSDNLPVFSEVLNFFKNTAKGIQEGRQEELVYSQEWLDIMWPADEYVFIKLCRENKLMDFYDEAESLLSGLINPDRSTDILRNAIKLNRSLIKLPFRNTDLKLELTHNVWELYKAVLVGQKVEVQAGRYQYNIDRTTKTDSANTNARWDSWEEWYEKMVWWCNRRGAYLYGNKNPVPDLAGHH